MVEYQLLGRVVINGTTAAGLSKSVAQAYWHGPNVSSHSKVETLEDTHSLCSTLSWYGLHSKLVRWLASAFD